MNDMFELIIAQRHILANRRSTIFTVLSVAIAVGVIIMSLGLNEGSLADVIKTTVENSPHITVQPKEDEDYIYLYRTLSGTIQEYPAVLAVSPRLIGEGAARYKDPGGEREFHRHRSGCGRVHIAGSKEDDSAEHHPS